MKCGFSFVQGPWRNHDQDHHHRWNTQNTHHKWIPVIPERSLLSTCYLKVWTHCKTSSLNGLGNSGPPDEPDFSRLILYVLIDSLRTFKWKLMASSEKCRLTQLHQIQYKLVLMVFGYTHSLSLHLVHAPWNSNPYLTVDYVLTHLPPSPCFSALFPVLNIIPGIKYIVYFVFFYSVLLCIELIYLCRSCNVIVICLIWIVTIIFILLSPCFFKLLSLV